MNSKITSKQKFFLAITSVFTLVIVAQNINISTSTANLSQPVANAQGADLNVSLSGAGASFPAPLYQRWFSEL